MAEATFGERLYVLARRDALAFRKLADRLDELTDQTQ